MRSWTWRTWVKVTVVSLTITIVWLFVYDKYVEAAPSLRSEQRMCHPADPCGITSTLQWQDRYRHDRVGHSRHGRIPPRVLTLTRHAWVHWYNRRHRTAIAEGHLARVSPNDLCKEQYGFSYLCHPLPDNGCVLSSYVCKPAPYRGAPVTGVNWSRVDKVTFKCGSAALFGAAGGGRTAGIAGAFYGAGLAAGGCAVDTIARSFGWWD